MRPNLFIALSLTASLASACDPEPAGPLTDPGEQLEFRCPTCGDTRDDDVLNTEGQNGVIIGSVPMDGSENDGVRLTDVSIRSEGATGIPLFDIYADHGVLHGTDADGRHYAGDDLVGSVWTFELGMDAFLVPPEEDPEAVVEWVMKVQSFISDGDRSRYVFTNGPTESQAETYSCDVDPETGEFSAILYSDLDVAEDGTHSVAPGSIYFGCTSGAVGKAGMWGYAQHAVGPDVHQAATRMVRADYCGTGQSFTQTGTRLQIQDDMGIRSFPDPGEITEAMWSPGGAVCLLQPRRPEYGYDTVLCGGQPLPFCENHTDLNDWGAMIWTKTMPQNSP